MCKERTGEPRPETQSTTCLCTPCGGSLGCLSFVPLLFLGGADLGLLSQVYDDTTTVAAAVRASAMRHARSATLAGSESARLKRVVRTAISRVRLGVPHADYHAANIPNKAFLGNMGCLYKAESLVRMDEAQISGAPKALHHELGAVGQPRQNGRRRCLRRRNADRAEDFRLAESAPPFTQNLFAGETADVLDALPFETDIRALVDCELLFGHVGHSFYFKRFLLMTRRFTWRPVATAKPSLRPYGRQCRPTSDTDSSRVHRPSGGRARPGRGRTPCWCRSASWSQIYRSSRPTSWADSP